MVEEGGRGLASRGTPLTGVERAGGKPSRAFSARPAAWPGGRHLSAREWMEEGTTATPEMERKRADATHARHRGRASDPAHLRPLGVCVPAVTRPPLARQQQSRRPEKTGAAAEDSRVPHGAGLHRALPQPPTPHPSSLWVGGGEGPRRQPAAEPRTRDSVCRRRVLPRVDAVLPCCPPGGRSAPLVARVADRRAWRFQWMPPRAPLSAAGSRKGFGGRGRRERLVGRPLPLPAPSPPSHSAAAPHPSDKVFPPLSVAFRRTGTGNCTQS